MLSVTNSVLEHLHDSLASVSAADVDDKCFRITPQSGESLGLSYSEPAASDTTYTFKDRVVLALPKDLEDVCSGKTLDINESGGLELA